MNYQGKHLTITVTEDKETTNTCWVFEVLVANRRIAYMTGNDGLFDRVCRQVVDLGMMIHLRLPHCYKWFEGINNAHLDEIWSELREFVTSYCGSHTTQKYNESRSKLVMIGNIYQPEGSTPNPLARLPNNVWVNTIYTPKKGNGWIDISYEFTHHPEQHTDLVTAQPGESASDARKRTREALRRGVRSFKWVMRRTLRVDTVYGLRHVETIDKIYSEYQAEIHRVLDIPLSIGDANYDRVTRQAGAAE